MSLKLAPGGIVIGAQGWPAYLSLTYLMKSGEDVVPVLAGVHAAAQFVATGPEGRVELGLL